MQPSVTVVIPCFNSATYLRHCVDSVKQQSYEAWECVIVDDGSTDDTAHVAKQLALEDERVRVLHIAQNRGPSAARNAGIRDARGQYIQFLDADDILEPDKVRIHVEYLANHPSTDIVFGPAAYFRVEFPTEVEPWNPDGASGISEDSDSSAILTALVKENVCMMHALLLRHHVFEVAGLFDENLRTHEDWELWLRCALRGMRFGFVSRGQDRALVRKHDSNTSRAFVDMWQSAVRVRERINPLLPERLARENIELLGELRRRIGVELVVR